jgi:RNA polymerase sigma-70 factor, ECF subfamily
MKTIARLEASDGREPTHPSDGSVEVEFVNRFAPILFGMLVQILKNQQEAEAVVEDVFQRFWSKQLDCRDDHASSDEAWLALVARLAAMQKRQGGKTASALRQCLNTISSTASWVAKDARVRRLDEKRDLLRKALSQLSKRQGELLRMALLEGKTLEEISTKTGEPLARVRAEQTAALMFLRHRFNVVLGTWVANL